MTLKQSVERSAHCIIYKTFYCNHQIHRNNEPDGRRPHGLSPRQMLQGIFVENVP